MLSTRRLQNVHTTYSTFFQEIKTIMTIPPAKRYYSYSAKYYFQLNVIVLRSEINKDHYVLIKCQSFIGRKKKSISLT